MLVELTDIKGETWWVNPAYVRVIREKKGRTEIWVTGHTTVIRVERPVAEVVTEISVALQGVNPMTAVQAGVQQAQNAAAAAASTAAINPAVMG
ncbi:MAG: hypothetical protein AAF138_04920 [Planctomycetota bacterium]